MKRIITLLAITAILVALVGYACNKSCCGTCQDKDGKCTDGTKCTSCEGECKCEAAAGDTGWCPETGTGLYKGQKVACKGECKANPGGPPCEACVVK